MLMQAHGMLIQLFLVELYLMWTERRLAAEARHSSSKGRALRLRWFHFLSLQPHGIAFLMSKKYEEEVRVVKRGSE